MYRAQTVHRRHFDSDAGAALHAALDQDRRLPRGLRVLPAVGALPTPASTNEPLLTLDAVVAAARARQGSTARRASAWARPGAGRRQRDLEPVLEMVRAVKALGLETCATLGLLRDGQAEQLQGGGPRLLQPQPRHRARVLRRDHHHARLRRPARHARAGARGRHAACAAAASSAWASRARSAPG